MLRLREEGLRARVVRTFCLGTSPIWNEQNVQIQIYPANNNDAVGPGANPPVRYQVIDSIYPCKIRNGRIRGTYRIISFSPSTSPFERTRTVRALWGLVYQPANENPLGNTLALPLWPGVKLNKHNYAGIATLYMPQEYILACGYVQANYEVFLPAPVETKIYNIEENPHILTVAGTVGTFSTALNGSNIATGTITGAPGAEIFATTAATFSGTGTALSATVDVDLQVTSELGDAAGAKIGIEGIPGRVGNNYDKFDERFEDVDLDAQGNNIYTTDSINLYLTVDSLGVNTPHVMIEGIIEFDIYR